MDDTTVLPGAAYPLGATVTPDGVNFAIYSHSATRVDLLLFDAEDAPQPNRVITLDPHENRTFYYWHCLIPDIGHGQLYGYRVHGPFDPIKGMRFDAEKVLVDPYARAISRKLYDRAAACRPGDNCAQAMRSVVVDTSGYDWQGDRPLRKRLERTVIYEMHVGGFTKDNTSGVAPHLRGTFAGLIEKIPYLLDLGINTVELLPVYQFDPADAPEGLTNYWGYSPVNFFAPHDGYASSSTPEAVVNEFRDMVRSLHTAGIAVYLDVVYNHTTENSYLGPTLSLRGLENVAYYIPGPTWETLADFTGCGNTLSANHSIVRRMILDSLRYWVTEMHVDGFRFDLASAMARGEFGEPLSSPPLLWEIESDPILSGVTVIAEAWDIGGLYQVGTFVGDRFAEWNDHFRDDIRRFVKGDLGLAAKVGLRMVGSPDIYPRDDRSLPRSINFVTAHDGMTMNDLVTYNLKHNHANGEENRDGSNQNHSWNSGHEGETDNPAINALRARQVRNMLVLLLLAQGTPMLLMGDEVRHTQQGNNNVYAQDNELAWFNWERATANSDLLRFVKALIALRKRYTVLHAERPLPMGEHAEHAYVSFHGVEPFHPNWTDDSRLLSFTFHQPSHAGQASEAIHIVANSADKAVTLTLPDAPSGMAWKQIVDTSAPSPDDIVPHDQANEIGTLRQRIGARSTRVYIAE